VRGLESRKTHISGFERSQLLLLPEAVDDYVGSDNLARFIAALGDVAKARGMAQIASDAGLGRESLYKALSAGAHPRYETISAVLRALGVKFSIVADRPLPR